MRLARRHAVGTAANYGIVGVLIPTLPPAALMPSTGCPAQAREQRTQDWGLPKNTKRVRVGAQKLAKLTVTFAEGMVFRFSGASNVSKNS